jgi:hypothetical protein
MPYSNILAQNQIRKLRVENEMDYRMIRGLEDTTRAEIMRSNECKFNCVTYVRYLIRDRVFIFQFALR